MKKFIVVAVAACGALATLSGCSTTEEFMLDGTEVGDAMWSEDSKPIHLSTSTHNKSEMSVYLVPVATFEGKQYVRCIVSDSDATTRTKLNYAIDCDWNSIEPKDVVRLNWGN